MSIPLLTYAPSSQNQRVNGFEIPGDENPRIYTTGTTRSPEEVNEVITAAYRQIFHEQQMLEVNRQRNLESQLRIGQITVREFVQGVATSDAFRRLNYEVNNNYRFVEMCIQRILGRSVYNDRERLAWSIVLATKGLNGFVDELVNSEEYLNNFGDDIVPYQRRRVLPQQSRGEQPFERMARYGTDYRDRLPSPTLLPGTSWSRNVGLFDKFEPFSWKAFVQRANWSMVFAVFLLVFGLSFLTLLVSSTTGSIVP
ncbi:phycobilisome rod-core linker polypeptide [Leptolyngbya sp. FACHB-8]|uniref:phycobilisome rod-core linker polypeptide n=1 Tax=unclassified Leptolyngbya TaxID=2650499 RepID=UPI001684CAB0|nr:phycobilisome rod-core linker polypeptide [Leptolyngbya sp. FACHB-8]MBD1913090.1 phycobilisome rod-core linker polypeptide [Leptolyngbya sp. FACHB-8]